MLIHRIDPDDYVEAYDILCQGAFPDVGAETHIPVYGMWCLVPAGGVAKSHRHQEHETFVIVRGRGRMRVGEEETLVEPGDAILMPPFDTHELTNLSDDEELLFLSVSWEHLQEVEARNAAAVAGERDALRNTLVTATPPTPNGNLHVGHLSGPYLAADALRRHLRMRGVDAMYLCGADDHQGLVEVKALRQGETPRQVADRYGAAIPETLRSVDVEMDHFALPKTSPYHAELVQDVFRRLVDRGHIVAREAPTFFCEPCDRWLFEGHVVGRCPHCGVGSCGNACEACGLPNDCVDLGEPRCNHCGEEPEPRPLERFYLRLEPLAKPLRAYWDRVSMSTHLRCLCEEMLSDGLPDIAVSHPSTWGIPVPIEGFEDQTIYVWFEMGPGFLAATREMLEARGDDGGWESVWKTDAWRTVQLFGFDNGYFHAVLFPATFLAYDEDIRLPEAFVTNEFYRYEGSKFSTSRNHALWGPELLERVSADRARFYLAYDGPEREQTNFRMTDLEAVTRHELDDVWQPWLGELDAKVRRYFDGVVPVTGAWTDEHQRFYGRLQQVLVEAEATYRPETFSLQRVARLLGDLVRDARRFGHAEEHLSHRPNRSEEWRTAMNLEVLAARILALVAAPIMPSFAEGLWRDLGEDGPLGEGSWPEDLELFPGGRTIGDLGRPRFERSA